MPDKKTKGCSPEGQAAKAAGQYPGASVDIADTEKVDPKLVKERTKTLDFNPHSDGI